LKFEKPIVKATLLKRYKRFLADAILEDGTEVTAHCPNTGSMKTCWEEGDIVYFTEHDDPKRKLKYTWELSETEGGYIGINTNMPNKIAFEAIANGQVKELTGYRTLKREIKYGENSRFDIHLSDAPNEPNCFVEIKNVTLYDSNANALTFPDSVTTRGQKHLKELMNVVKGGERAVMLYVLNRPEGNYFSPASEIDPEYARLLKEASESGVEILAYRVNSSPSELNLAEPVPIKL
jgi:sugar fermentation stimulation protein A